MYSMWVMCKNILGMYMKEVHSIWQSFILAWEID